MGLLGCHCLPYLDSGGESSFSGWLLWFELNCGSSFAYQKTIEILGFTVCMRINLIYQWFEFVCDLF